MTEVKLKCRDCGQTFTVDDDIPLKEQMDRVHIWNIVEDEQKNGCALRHRSEDDDGEYDW